MGKDAPYTLAELPSLLVPGADEIVAYKVTRKVQNWVTLGLAHPAENPHGGRGVHRRYDDEEIAKLRVLFELARYGMPTTVLQRSAGLFDDMRENGPLPARWLSRTDHRNPSRALTGATRLWRRAQSGEGEAFLVMTPNQDDWDVKLVEEAHYPKGTLSAVIVDVGRALRGPAR